MRGLIRQYMKSVCGNTCESKKKAEQGTNKPRARKTVMTVPMAASSDEGQSDTDNEDDEEDED